MSRGRADAREGLRGAVFRDFVWVEDCVDAFVRAAGRPWTADHNVATGRKTYVRELVD